MSGLKVEKLLHWNDPTLSAKEAEVQRHNEMLGLIASIAAVNSQVFFHALTCPIALHSPLLGSPTWPLNLLLTSSTQSAESSLCKMG